MLDSDPRQSQFILSSPAKINLHLEILGIRADGFHELAMVMQSVDLADTLFFKANSNARISLTCNNPRLVTDEKNLIIQAAQLLKSRSGLPNLGAIIGLEKRIPIGAGLAGGSSNCAATLIGLNKLWNLEYTPIQLLNLATELGSDIPFTMKGGSQFCFGRGEVLEFIDNLKIKAPNLAILIIKSPETSVSTPWAFKQYKEARQNQYLTEESDFDLRRQILRKGQLTLALKGQAPFPAIQNDLQEIVEEHEESVRQGLNLLKSRTESLAIAMSGSGPSLFALFDTLESAQVAQFQLAVTLRDQGYESWCTSLLSHGIYLDDCNE
uniref:4-(cytidine 5'-diphospho)-2-C-methyl-D-erythritol kinase n=1 Tax=Paulinella micropora TaxID=1928728 RepID=A0A385HZV5_9EUKA|nr:putative 4-diphosphocytidyl-2C-methyl-D- erythritol kinase [Paulinella micropora]AXY63189.1 putative 4-diphosphocytidyl-2C-methyl-D- erythritol kinase [Paulinella micropora]